MLTPLECRELFTVLRRMAAQGKTVIIITHKLREVMEIADHITVLSRGETKGTLRKEDTSEQELAARMMGKAGRFHAAGKGGSAGGRGAFVRTESDGCGMRPAWNGFGTSPLMCGPARS